MQKFPTKMAIATGVPFGVVMAAFLYWLVGTDGIVAGLVAGGMFGSAMAKFAAAQAERMAASEGQSFEGESVITQGAANHFAKGESRGGWLTLTPTKLAFRSHGKNIQNHPIDIPLSRIKQASPARTLGIVPNGLHVALRDGSVERFVVQNRAVWAERIKVTVAGAGPPKSPAS
jgi:hypothetical protein